MGYPRRWFSQTLENMRKRRKNCHETESKECRKKEGTADFSSTEPNNTKTMFKEVVRATEYIYI
jgi:hypothetical protein